MVEVLTQEHSCVDSLLEDNARGVIHAGFFILELMTRVSQLAFKFTRADGVLLKFTCHEIVLICNNVKKLSNCCIGMYISL